MSLVPCFYCQKGIDPKSIFAFRRVIGWEARGTGQTRKGGSDITARERLDEYACSECVERLRRGLSPLQQTLGDAA